MSGLETVDQKFEILILKYGLKILNLLVSIKDLLNKNCILPLSYLLVYYIDCKINVYGFVFYERKTEIYLSETG